MQATREHGLELEVIELQLILPSPYKGRSRQDSSNQIRVKLQHGDDFCFHWITRAIRKHWGIVTQRRMLALDATKPQKLLVYGIPDAAELEAWIENAKTACKAIPAKQPWKGTYRTSRSPYRGFC